jgi:hypothetical protein
MKNRLTEEEQEMIQQQIPIADDATIVFEGYDRTSSFTAVLERV